MVLLPRSSLFELLAWADDPSPIIRLNLLASIICLKMGNWELLGWLRAAILPKVPLIKIVYLFSRTTTSLNLDIAIFLGRHAQSELGGCLLLTWQVYRAVWYLWWLQRTQLVVTLLYRGTCIGIRLVIFVWRCCKLLGVVGLLIEASIEERAIDAMFVYETCRWMVTSWATAGHRLEVSDRNLRTNSSLVGIRAFWAPRPSSCLSILCLVVYLCSNSSLVSSLLFP